ncbi:hypothetical protein EJ04DRAFT_25611 [Polyplosphaeria fusca]|uniref:Uncharacterized protein n=1 Tax=Polyplosphaeria fusca TaxID=682080 RepID=A0A9P4R7Z0_9PLEO|nr:hypothetical protein EJ04DRAFT_25611 [Polyplosphaeria fusca]
MISGSEPGCTVWDIRGAFSELCGVGMGRGGDWKKGLGGLARVGCKLCVRWAILCRGLVYGCNMSWSGSWASRVGIPSCWQVSSHAACCSISPTFIDISILRVNSRISGFIHLHPSSTFFGQFRQDAFIPPKRKDSGAFLIAHICLSIKTQRQV